MKNCESGLAGPRLADGRAGQLECCAGPFVWLVPRVSGSGMADARGEGGKRSEIRETIAAGELSIDSGKSIRAWRPSTHQTVWSADIEDRFMETLAESCNVLLASKAAGVRQQLVYSPRSASLSRPLPQGERA